MGNASQAKCNLNRFRSRMSLPRSRDAGTHGRGAARNSFIFHERHHARFTDVETGSSGKPHTSTPHHRIWDPERSSRSKDKQPRRSSRMALVAARSTLRRQPETQQPPWQRQRDRANTSSCQLCEPPLPMRPSADARQRPIVLRHLARWTPL